MINPAIDDVVRSKSGHARWDDGDARLDRDERQHGLHLMGLLHEHRHEPCFGAGTDDPQVEAAPFRRWPEHERVVGQAAQGMSSSPASR
jgi:hypothetical protein